MPDTPPPDPFDPAEAPDRVDTFECIFGRNTSGQAPTLAKLVSELVADETDPDADHDVDSEDEPPPTDDEFEMELLELLDRVLTFPR